MPPFFYFALAIEHPSNPAKLLPQPEPLTNQEAQHPHPLPGKSEVQLGRAIKFLLTPT